ncbi:MAG TPA: site-2 protease family protein [Phenylobacterium sp.]|nr:site-2 protease family protein [Phenylobacterium sp.]
MTAVPPTPGPPPRAAPPPPAAPPPKPPNNLVGLGVLVGLVAAGVALDRGVAPKLTTFAFVMLAWVLSVMAHEFAHAITGYVAGDWTVRPKGYLSFDPRRYGDVGTSLVLPLVFLALGGIGFPGGAVYLRNDLMRSRLWRSAAALAGPAATLVVLLVLASVLRIWMASGTVSPLFPALAFLAFLQATALILNLLPVPGLDGFGAIRPFLPAEWAPQLRRVEGLVMVAMFLLIFLTPVGGQLIFGTGAKLAARLGVPVEAVQIGFESFRFWR